MIQKSLASHQFFQPSSFDSDASSQPDQSDQEMCHRHYHKSLHLPSSWLFFSEILEVCKINDNEKSFKKRKRRQIDKKLKMPPSIIKIGFNNVPNYI